MRGTVKWGNSSKGFGFLLPSDDGPDVFVHVSSLQKSNLRDLREGSEVFYDVKTGKDGRPAAENLAVIKD
jgi:CspA family cold shock protein